MPTLSLSEVLTVLDAARKHDEWIATFQQKGYSEKDRAASFAASLEADAHRRETAWRLPEGPL